MEKVEIKHLLFGSYIKLALQIGFIAGTTQSVLVIIISLFRQSFLINLGSWHFSGLFAVIFLTLLNPIIAMIIAAIIAVLTYLPYLLFTGLFPRTTLYYAVAKERNDVSRSNNDNLSLKNNKKDDYILSADDPRYLEMKLRRE